MNRNIKFATPGTAALLVGAVLVIAVLALTKGQTLNAQTAAPEIFVPDEVIVQFRTTASESQIANAL